MSLDKMESLLGDESSREVERSPLSFETAGEKATSEIQLQTMWRQVMIARYWKNYFRYVKSLCESLSLRIPFNQHVQLRTTWS